MLWLAVPTINRYRLTINEERSRVNPYSYEQRRWLNDIEIGNWFVMQSPASVLSISDGNVIRINSQKGYPQKYALVERESMMVHATLNIGANGVCTIRAESWHVNQPPSPIWQSNLTAVLGFDSGYTLTIVDCQDRDVDLFRHRARNNTVFIPQRYVSGTMAYDLAQPSNLRAIMPPPVQNPIVPAILPPQAQNRNAMVPPPAAGPSSALAQGLQLQQQRSSSSANNNNDDHRVEPTVGEVQRAIAQLIVNEGNVAPPSVIDALQNRPPSPSSPNVTLQASTETVATEAAVPASNQVTPDDETEPETETESNSNSNETSADEYLSIFDFESRITTEWDEELSRRIMQSLNDSN